MTPIFNIGDRVLITHKKRIEDIRWVDDMNNAIGKIGTITNLFNPNNKSLGYIVEVDGCRANWNYPAECLKLYKGESMSDIAFKKDDIVLIKFKLNAPYIGWDSEMDKAINVCGKVISPYIVNDKVYGYTILVNGFTKTWVFPTDCLEPVYPINFNVGERVLVWRKPEDRELLRRTHWIEDMDECIGSIGTISEDYDDDDDDSKEGFQIQFDNGNSFYFPKLALARANYKDKPIKEKWFLGYYSGLPYKSTKKNKEGFYIIQNENNEEFSSEFFKLNEAPVECQSFSYRKKPSTVDVVDF